MEQAQQGKLEHDKLLTYKRDFKGLVEQKKEAEREFGYQYFKNIQELQRDYQTQLNFLKNQIDFEKGTKAKQIYSFKVENEQLKKQL